MCKCIFVEQRNEKVYYVLRYKKYTGNLYNPSRAEVVGLLGPAIFVSFFLLFMLVSAAVPVPLFPGNMIPTWLGISDSPFASYLGAIANGAIYGFGIWLAFNLGYRRYKRANLETATK